jgi:hypothetical protein
MNGRMQKQSIRATRVAVQTCADVQELPQGCRDAGQFLPGLR